MNRYDGFYLLDHHRNRHKSPGPAGEYNSRRSRGC